jgi:cell shape-determining protein MreC
MARSTPTYTPAGKYVLGGIISAVLLIADLNYQTFTSVRGLTQASGIYTQLILGNILEYTSNVTVAYKDKKDLMTENQKLKDERLSIKNKIFLEQLSQLTSKNILDAQEPLKDYLDQELAQSFKIASFDLKNYLCCSSHTLYLSNPNKLDVASNLPVSNGHTFIGQTSGRDLNLIKVILLSDTSHILPIKIKDFYCNAEGAGRPLEIKCIVPQKSESSNLKVNDLALSSGLGGVFPNNIEIGRVRSVINNNLGESEILIGLDGDPLQQNYFGIFLGL